MKFFSIDVYSQFFFIIYYLLAFNQIIFWGLKKSKSPTPPLRNSHPISGLTPLIF